MVLMKSGCH